ncbi:MAG: hypothetical protein E7456_03220 [Ruminococcaceae bacterium]|nr:hypothetical protein [Oscillospiraceae bacterium]
MDKKRSAKKFTLSRIIIPTAAFIVIVGVLVLVAVNLKNPSTDAFGKTLKSWFGIGSRAETFEYGKKEPTAFAVVNDGIAAASKTGFIIFDKWGDKVVDKDVVMERPVVVSNGSVSGFYDCGGYTLFIAGDNGNIESYVSDKKLVSVSVNKEGWFTLCTEEENYKGSVTVLNDKHNAVYKFYSGDGYILSAELSDDCRMLLAVKLTPTGTDVVEYSLDSEEEQARISLSSQVAVGCEYGGYGDISILTDEAFYVYDNDGNPKECYDFSEYDLDGFSLEDDGYSVISCGASLADARSYLATLDDTGNLIAKQETAKTIVDISAGGQYIAVLYTDGLTVYDKNLREQKTYEITNGADAVVMCDDGTVMVTSEYSAQVLG